MFVDVVKRAILQLSPENQRWLDDFKAKHGRMPRILHIGNIANNAYNNAKLLNEAGLDCDVICYDYYHIMGCPEWEDADISGDYGGHFKPNWVAAGIKNFERPRWFAQGSLLDCINYLVAKRKGNAREANVLWCNLEALNGSPLPQDHAEREALTLWKARIRNWAGKIFHTLCLFLFRSGTATRIATTCDQGRVASLTNSEMGRILAALCLLAFALVVRVIGSTFAWLAKSIWRESDYSFDTRVAELVAEYAKAFPSRMDALTTADVEMYRYVAPHWHRLFEQYDLVQAYATDPMLPMLADKRPYVGFEHGTLRSHTLCNEQICRLTSLGYHLADHVFITNGDCIDYARKIGVTRFTPMLHPVDERRINAIEGDYERLHNELGVRYIFLCTLRHDWAIKGTDKYIRALPGLVELLGRDFRVIMTQWGTELERSMALAESLNVADLIIWSAPLSRRQLIKTLKSVDVLFDQLALPHFGATAPEGIAAGVPVIMSYDPQSTAWLVSEPAPILAAHDSAGIVSQVSQALDPAWLRDYRRRAERWFDEQHSSRIVVQKHFEVYSRLISAS